MSYYFVILAILLIAIIIAITYYIHYIYKNTDSFDINNVYFMTSKETKSFLLKDEDNYVNNLTKYDLYARKVKSSNEYLNNISNSSIDFSKEEISRLTKCSYDADKFFRNLSDKYLNGKEISKIKWIYSITDKNVYEEGLPHTRMNIIFLSNKIFKNTDNELTSTLIHEKIHIYQRYNPLLFNKIIASMNYSIVDKSSIEKNHLIRSNPDVNNNIYIDNNTKKLLVCKYRNEKPNSINDVIINSFAIEHPYEKIAYDIANYYNDISKYINI